MLTITKIIGAGKHKRVLAQCDCGGSIEALEGNIRAGRTSSCGCLRVLDRSKLPPEAPEGCAYINLGNGNFALVDKADYEIHNKRLWFKSTQGYACSPRPRPEGGGTLFLHLEITGLDMVDHENRNRLDNRRENLRATNKQTNGANRGKTALNTTGFKGVSRSGKRFGAYIGKKESGRVRSRYLGSYDTAEEAARAYDAEARKLFGEFAGVNFPEETP